MMVRIKIKGNLDEHWSEWFSGCEIVQTVDNETLILGEIQDQPALYGLIARVRDLGLLLVEVKTIEV